MKRLMVVLFVLVPALSARADGWSSSFSLVNGVVGLTNSQANSVWAPVALLFKFNLVTNGALTVLRVTQGSTYLVCSQSVVNASTSIWIPEASYPDRKSTRLNSSHANI